MRPTKSRSWLTRLTKGTAHASGQPIAFTVAVLVVLVWALTGPIFRFSDTWQLVINTSTTIEELEESELNRIRQTYEQMAEKARTARR